jgi:Queuosine salvage protein
MNPYTASLRVIWERPTCVWLDHAAIARLAERLAEEEFEIPAWRQPVFPDDDYVFLDFISVGNSINFAFTDFKTGRSFSVTHNGTGWRGAFAMWACLRRALDSGIDILSGDFLREISWKQVRELFSADTEIPLIEERRAILREIGAILCERFGGRFRNLLMACNERAFGEGGLVTQLVESFPSFRDESLHQASATLLKFEKRAQLLAMMYQGRALSSVRLPTLDDADEVGPIADYSIPRALRAAGAIHYSPDLQSRIANKIAIPRDSVEEQELRAQAALAQIALRDSIERLGRFPINFVSLDYKLWTLGRTVDAPHHLTKTTAY